MRGDVHDWVKRWTPEPEHDKPTLKTAFDEIVIGPNDGVHIERLCDTIYWMAVHKGEDQQIIIFSSVSGRAAIVGRTEADG